MPENDSIRCSDDDRRETERLLSAAYADGRLNRSEFDERSSKVWQARTFGELRPTTADLVESEAHRPQTGGSPASPNSGWRLAASNQPDDGAADRIVSVMSTQNRKDHDWRFHRRTNVLVVMGETNLDLISAVFEDLKCEISVSIAMGSLNLLVPAGVTVVDRTVTIMGGSSQKGLLPEPDGPVIEISGTVIMGSVDVKGPETRQGRKALRKR